MAVYLSRIYTRTGDQGQSSLVGGQRLSKCSLRLESYGTVDELNALMGVIASQWAPTQDWQKQSQQWIHTIQQELFDLGSVLATAAEDSFAGMASFEEDRQCQRLEGEIDLMLQGLPPLRSFVLPGGNMPNAYAHLARTVCRRAERLVCGLEEQEPSRPGTMRYLNRLSDWLFVFSRYLSAQMGCKEILWQSTHS